MLRSIGLEDLAEKPVEEKKEEVKLYPIQEEIFEEFDRLNNSRFNPVWILNNESYWFDTAGTTRTATTDNIQYIPYITWNLSGVFSEPPTYGVNYTDLNYNSCSELAISSSTPSSLNEVRIGQSQILDELNNNVISIPPHLTMSELLESVGLNNLNKK